VDLLGAKMEIPVKQTLHSILASAKGTHIKGLSVRGKAQIPAKKLPRGGSASAPVKQFTNVIFDVCYFVTFDALNQRGPITILTHDLLQQQEVSDV
jgi:hypothetical protein